MKRTATTLAIILGSICVTAGMSILVLTFWPILKAETTYTVRHMGGRAQTPHIVPVDDSFGIVIPKLGANAHIVPNVDPYNEKDYQKALTGGVAHARGTVFPGNTGNVFLFAHSASDFFVANQYNAIFYLIGKLSTGDEIDLYYQKHVYVYRVTGQKMVAPKDVTFLTAQTTKKTLTLMTCWPPGTTLSRLIVQAEIAAP